MTHSSFAKSMWFHGIASSIAIIMITARDNVNPQLLQISTYASKTGWNNALSLLNVMAIYITSRIINKL